MIIKRAKDRVVTDTIEEIGSCHCVSFMNEQESYEAGDFFGICTMDPGNKTKYHTHEKEYEVYHILSGHAKYYQDGKEYDLMPGDTSLCPLGSWHSIENIGDSELKFVALMLFPEV